MTLSCSPRPFLCAWVLPFTLTHILFLYAIMWFPVECPFFASTMAFFGLFKWKLDSIFMKLNFRKYDCVSAMTKKNVRRNKASKQPIKKQQRTNERTKNDLKIIIKRNAFRCVFKCSNGNGHCTVHKCTQRILYREFNRVKCVRACEEWNKQNESRIASKSNYEIKIISICISFAKKS